VHDDDVLGLGVFAELGPAGGHGGNHEFGHTEGKGAHGRGADVGTLIAADADHALDFPFVVELAGEDRATGHHGGDAAPLVFGGQENLEVFAGRGGQLHIINVRLVGRSRENAGVHHHDGAALGFDAFLQKAGLRRLGVQGGDEEDGLF
jgi:hypothetical protein